MASFDSTTVATARFALARLRPENHAVVRGNNIPARQDFQAGSVTAPLKASTPHGAGVRHKRGNRDSHRPQMMPRTGDRAEEIHPEAAESAEPSGCPRLHALTAGVRWLSPTHLATARGREEKRLILNSNSDRDRFAGLRRPTGYELDRKDSWAGSSSCQPTCQHCHRARAAGGWATVVEFPARRRT
jgi:hypothetical protein